MKYRKFGKLGWEVSALGFGAMRLPVTDNLPAPGNQNIDEAEAIKMMRYAIDHGVNYLDTAYPYHGGQSEVVVGRALQDGYREKIKLATKMPSWFIQSYEDFDKFLNEQLVKLQTDHIDCYLLHGLNKQNWPKLRDLDVLEWAEKTKADGRIGNIGFSFHDDLETFKQIIDTSDRWNFCQIQYNFMDIEYQAGTAGLKYAADKGLAVVIMEPLRGGQLSKEPPETIKAIWEKAPQKRSPVDWALQWLWNQPEVSVVLSGMTTMPQVVENVACAERSGIGTLNEQELMFIEEVREKYRKLSPIPCTSCGYCMPCPNGVNIPHAFRYYNDAMMYNDPRTARFRYRQEPKEAWADQCIECLECEEKCPQQIPIAEWLKKVHEYLGPKKKT
jgi:predicted aldo/keto reductase-like oxidoreductase